MTSWNKVTKKAGLVLGGVGVALYVYNHLTGSGVPQITPEIIQQSPEMITEGLMYLGREQTVTRLIALGTFLYASGATSLLEDKIKSVEKRVEKTERRSYNNTGTAPHVRY